MRPVDFRPGESTARGRRRGKKTRAGKEDGRWQPARGNKDQMMLAVQCSVCGEGGGLAGVVARGPEFPRAKDRE